MTEDDHHEFYCKSFIGDLKLFVKIAKLDSIFMKSVIKIGADLEREKIGKPGR